MSFLNIFKKKKKPLSEKPSVKKEEKEIEKKEERIIEKAIEKKELKSAKKGAVIYGVVKEPHISEKATDLGAVGRYVFKVFPRANKNEIKKAIKFLYGVDVLAVNIITISAKERRLGRTKGFKRGYKKAIVRIKKGQKIEIL
ncbi:50S ribosomal protein L23 [Patescibacteria group bacterium]|nr:50S ribosomal protein L23 [Patescibacteria group bacterium]